MEEKMADIRQNPENFEEFMAEYNAAELPKGKHINSSKYTLNQQLERFRGFSHSKEDCEKIAKEARGI